MADKLISSSDVVILEMKQMDNHQRRLLFSVPVRLAKINVLDYPNYLEDNCLTEIRDSTDV